MEVQTLDISTGLVRLPISVDGVDRKVIAFNPNETIFTEKFLKAYHTIKAKANEWEARAPEIEKEIKEQTRIDEDGVPLDLDTVHGVAREVNLFMREQIDYVFGGGTSEEIFNKAVYENPEVYITLFVGIEPYIKKARTGLVDKYLSNDAKKRIETQQIAAMKTNRKPRARKTKKK